MVVFSFKPSQISQVEIIIASLVKQHYIIEIYDRINRIQNKNQTEYYR